MPHYLNEAEMAKFQESSTKEVFTEIYKRKLWGNRQGAEYDSGPGSSGEIVTLYTKHIKAFIVNKGIKSVVDLGCGDYTVGSQLRLPEIRYTGVDIVRGLIDRNLRMFANSNTFFYNLNICEDKLPDGDLCLIRQVLQHLNNREIQQILTNIKKYPYVIVTEHLPAPEEAIPNLDLIHGPGIRLESNSGVYLDKPPFSLPNTQVFLDILMDRGLFKANSEHIVSTLISNS